MLVRKVLEGKEDFVSGEYRVFGGPRQWFLSDATGCIPFHTADIDTVAGSYSPSINDVVRADLFLEYSDDNLKVIGRVKPLNAPSQPLLNLMHPAVTYPSLVEELARYIQEMKFTPLKDFVNSLLLEDEVALGLVRARASFDHHHPEQGGLLRHVVEMAKAALEQDFWLKPSAYERELLLVAVIIHDIGKVDADILSRKKKAFSRKHHKEIGKELVKQPLKQLELDSPHVARDLRAIIHDVLGKYKTSQTKVGRLLQGLDQDSAYRDGDLLSFKDTPAHVSKAHLNGKPGPGRTYYRLRHLTVIK